MADKRTPGVPKLLRVLNDQAAMKLLMEKGPQTRAQLAEHTNMSKVTASQIVERLQRRGLVEIVGTKSGGRGPNAALYAPVASYTYVVGVDAGPHSARAACADFAGRIVGEAHAEVGGSSEPVSVVRGVVHEAVANANTDLSKVSRIVLGTPGVIDPESGEIGFSWDLPAWHRGLLTALNQEFKPEVSIENDVNLATIAEQRYGVAAGASDFLYTWYGQGIGLGVILNNELYRGRTGAAGEMGFLPVPGGEVPSSGVVTRLSQGSYQRVLGGEAIASLADDHGYDTTDPAEICQRALSDGDNGSALLDELARRIAYGVAASCIVLDPAVVVLGGPIGYAGGLELAERVAAQTAQIAPVNPNVVAGTVSEDTVLRGAIRAGLDVVGNQLFES
ncbi:ROK family transcriptional regulator [Haloglycomyces albus]|uniref:ROK family transcriptional regulator n=1 Tax=Haloglycomyces albus TaxID=526067 RepID=UPI0004A225A5|nr:ROK family transcriptional regulator [Haloglycomyces albus]